MKKFIIFIILVLLLVGCRSNSKKVDQVKNEEVKSEKEVIQKEKNENFEDLFNSIIED